MGPRDNEFPGHQEPQNERPAGSYPLPQRQSEAPAGDNLPDLEEIDVEDEEDTVLQLIEAARSGHVTEVRQFVRQIFHRGPLPPASELQAYENTLPGLANSIVEMAKKEQAIRGRDTSHNNWNTTFKIGASIVVSLGMVIGGVYCAAIGEPVVGGAIATSGVIGGVISSFLNSSSKKSADKDDDE